MTPPLGGSSYRNSPYEERQEQRYGSVACSTGTFRPGPDYHASRITLAAVPVVSGTEPDPPIALVGVVIVRQVYDEERLKAIAIRAAKKHGAAFAWLVPRRYARSLRDHTVVAVMRLPVLDLESGIEERRIVLYNSSRFSGH